MKSYDLLINGGFIVTPEDCRKGVVAVSDGKIADILYDGEEASGTTTINVEGRYVMAGAIDTHSHFFEPGAPYREGFAHGTQAAAAGGYTTVMDMPNTVPAVADEESFWIKYDLAKKNCFVDFVIWGASIPGKLANIPRLHELGCPAFKAFTLDAGPDFPYSDAMDLYLGMSEVRRVGGVFAVHAEDGSIIRRLKKQYESTTWTPAIHNKCRPFYSETLAIGAAIAAAKTAGCPLHICHVSSPEAVELAASARSGGVDVTVETCPHYLTLNADDAAGKSTYAMICPPLRDRNRMERMWELLEAGLIDYIGTDHAPYTVEDKTPDNLWDACAGAPSLDIAFPLILDEGFKRRGISLQKLTGLLSANAAKRFGLYPQKGVLQKDADADIVIVDMNKDWIYSRRNSFSKTKVTEFAYEGRKLGCSVETTLVRGEVVYHNGEITGKAGFGRHALNKGDCYE